MLLFIKNSVNKEVTLSIYKKKPRPKGNLIKINRDRMSLLA